MCNVKTVFVDVNILMPKKLQKDLQEDEMLCPICRGLGLVKREQVYGISGYRDPGGRHFPFKYENMQECHNCYNGIVKFCKYCGHPNRNKEYVHAETSCQCEQALAERDKENHQKDLEKWEKAEKIPYSEAIKRFGMLYIDNYDSYIMDDGLKEWIDERKADDKEFTTEGLRIYGTSTTKLAFSATDIIENNSEELHEEANENISEEAEIELQELLDAWVEEHASGTETYWPDYTVGILLG